MTTPQSASLVFIDRFMWFDSWSRAPASRVRAIDARTRPATASVEVPARYEGDRSDHAE
ncbi:Hypothetical protein A7982_00084 [Minicystis rosea]|nr:Hypothetical protein A7982_00084 [Minicystis rosea]